MSSIFDKGSMLQHTQSQLNDTSDAKVYFNEFVANALHDNIGSKKAYKLRKKLSNNQTQWHKINNFDFSNFRTKPAELDFFLL